MNKTLTWSQKEKILTILFTVSLLVGTASILFIAPKQREQIEKQDKQIEQLEEKAEKLEEREKELVEVIEELTPNIEKRNEVQKEINDRLKPKVSVSTTTTTMITSTTTTSLQPTIPPETTLPTTPSTTIPQVTIPPITVPDLDDKLNLPDLAPILMTTLAIGLAVTFKS